VVFQNLILLMVACGGRPSDWREARKGVSAIDRRNSALADDVAVALRRAGYQSGLLVLDTEDRSEPPGNDRGITDNEFIASLFDPSS
jgi:hypothetical protein